VLGVSRPRAFFTVTLPLLLPAIFLVQLPWCSFSVFSPSPSPFLWAEPALPPWKWASTFMLATILTFPAPQLWDWYRFW
jgi:hypothetical protein